MKGIPTQKQGNIPRKNLDNTPDKSGDGMELPKYTPPQKK